MARDARGVVAMEFAVVASVAIVTCFLVVEIGLQTWTNVALTTAAADAARCAAIGSSSCSTPVNYTVSDVAKWLFPNAVSASDVTVTTATSCNGAPGQYTVISVGSSNWIGSNLPSALHSSRLTATSCFVSSN